MFDVPICEECGKRRVIMVAMAPGKDGKEWWLCPKCHESGCRRKNGELAVVPPVDPPKPKKTPKQPERSAAKVDVGSFDKYPNESNEPEGSAYGLSYTGGIRYVPDDDGYW